LTLAVGLTAGAAGCAGTESGGGEEGRPRVGFVVINQEALFFKELIRGVQKAADDNNVDLAITNGNNDTTTQNNAVETYTQQKLDAIIVNPIDADGIKPSLRAAKEAGVDVIAVDAVLNDPSVLTEVGTDNLESGRQMGEFVVQWAEENAKGKKLRIGEVAALNSTVQIARQKGFDPVVEQAGHEIIQVVDGKNVQETALQAAEDLITGRGKRMDAVYATGEPALLGTLAAAKSQKATDDLTIFGWDLTKEAIAGIDDGYVAGIVQQDPYTEGVRAVEAAVQAAKGETPPKRIAVPITIVTKDNVDDFRDLFSN
jgi:ribose transport system substrate-binding protein